MNFIGTALIGLVLSGTALAFSEWDGLSNPDIIRSGFTHRLYDLPLEGAIFYGPRGWSGHYWPSIKGGINNRWNSRREKDQYDFVSPTRDQIFRMNANQLSTLSPSEKYDIFMGRYDFPLKQEVYSHARRDGKEWEGICHGWALVSLMYDEPTAVTLRNPDGINVPFGSADVKALLSYYYAWHVDAAPARQIGQRCNFGRWTGGQRACDDDLNAGAFHIVLTNKIALQKEGFVMDVERWDEVWNQPVIGYSSRVVGTYTRPSPSAARNAVSELKLATTVWYVDEDEPSWYPNFGTNNQVFAKKELIYRLELDSQGQIVGGAWESEERPDFVWSRPKETSFQGILARLPLLLKN